MAAIFSRNAQKEAKTEAAEEHRSICSLGYSCATGAKVWRMSVGIVDTILSSMPKV